MSYIISNGNVAPTGWTGTGRRPTPEDLFDTAGDSFLMAEMGELGRRKKKKGFLKRHIKRVKKMHERHSPLWKLLQKRKKAKAKKKRKAKAKRRAAVREGEITPAEAEAVEAKEEAEAAIAPPVQAGVPSYAPSYPPLAPEPEIPPAYPQAFAAAYPPPMPETMPTYEELPPPRYAAPPGTYRYDTAEEVPQEYDAPDQYEEPAEQYAEGEPGGAPAQEYVPDTGEPPEEGEQWGEGAFDGLGQWGTSISSFATRAYSGAAAGVKRAAAPATDWTPAITAVSQVIPSVLQAYQAQKALKQQAKEARRAAALEASRGQAVPMPGYSAPTASAGIIPGVPNVVVLGGAGLALFLLLRGGRR